MKIITIKNTNDILEHSKNLQTTNLIAININDSNISTIRNKSIVFITIEEASNLSNMILKDFKAYYKSKIKTNPSRET